MPPMSDEANEVTQALEPCPFCGAAAAWREYDEQEPYRKFGIVVEHLPSCMFSLPDGKEAWIAAWNTRTAASQASAGEGLRVLKGWLDWYRFATGDDDCEYLNDKGWGDAEALASTTMGVLAALTTPVEASQPVGDAGEAMSKRTFLTCVSGDGPQPYLKVHFNNLADAHAAHDELLGRKGES